jgi:hypothetical protein
MVMSVEETFPILDEVVPPPAKGGAARPKKSDLDTIQKEKKVSLEGSTRFDKVSDSLRRLFSTPSLMKGEDPDVYSDLYTRVEEVVQPQDVLDQMMLTDVTNHFWEQQRYRRCTGTVINCKRRAALEKILREAIGLNDVDTETAADSYFEVARLEEREVIDYATQVPIPKTRAGVVDLMEKYGFVETDIDRVAMETSVDTLAGLENLALKHEIRREAIVRELDRCRSCIMLIEFAITSKYPGADESRGRRWRAICAAWSRKPSGSCFSIRSRNSFGTCEGDIAPTWRSRDFSFDYERYDCNGSFGTVQQGPLPCQLSPAPEMR